MATQSSARIVSAPNSEMVARIRRDHARKTASRRRAAALRGARRRSAPLKASLRELAG